MNYFLTLRYILLAVILAAATACGNPQPGGLVENQGQELEIVQGDIVNPVTTCPAGGVTIPTSATAADMQAAVDRNPTGTLFCLASGEHTHLAPVKLRAGNRIIGLGKATVRGAAAITNWTQHSATRWSTVIPSLTKPSLVPSWYLHCDDGTDHCVYPDDVYYGDSGLARVWSRDAQGAGEYYVDYATKTLYVGVNPALETVYRAVPLPLSSSGYGVGLFDSNQPTPGQFSYLTITMVGTAMETGAINGFVSVDHVDVSFSHGKGVNARNGGRVTNSHVHHNGQIGIGAHRGAPVIADNEVDNNNWARCRGVCGGVKFADVDGAIAQRNNIHDNHDKGLWFDVGSINYLADSNRILRNSGIGMSLEISYDGVVSHNVVEGNGWGVSTRLGGIVVQATGSCRCAAGRRGAVEVFGNRVGGTGANGIALQATNRGSGDRGPYIVRDVYVHDNTVRLSGDAFVGASDSIGNQAVFSSGANNRFRNNVYSKGVDTKLFKWSYGGRSNQYLTFLQWKSVGQDGTGSCSGTGC